MKKKVLSLLLAAAMLLSVSAMPVLAADTGAADNTSAAQSAEAAAETGEAAATTIDEVTATMDTVDAAEAEETEEAIEEVSAEMATVEAAITDTSNYTVTTSTDPTMSAYNGNSSVTNEQGFSVNSTSGYTGILVTHTTGWGGLTGTVSKTATDSSNGIYFELYDLGSRISTSGTNLNLEVSVNGSAYGFNNGSNFQLSAIDYVATSVSVELSDGTEYASATLYQCYVPYSGFSSDITNAMQAASSFTFRLTFGGGSYSPTIGSGGTVYLLYDNFGVYVDATATGPVYDYDSCEDAREENNVVVVQDFEYSTGSNTNTGEEADDVFSNGAASVTASVGTGYLDSQSAQFYYTTTGAQNLRMQTSATALAGTGLYFEIDSSAAVALGSNATVSLFDSTSGQGQANGGTQLGSQVNAGDVAQYMYSISDTTYAVMIPWSAFSITDISSVTISKGFSFRIWNIASFTTAGTTFAVDNVGFYTFGEDEATLGASSDSNTATTTTIYGYGSDTIYAKVSADDIGSYSNTNYPTTVLTYGDNNYIFAGWYEDGIGETPCTKTPSTAAYAKFVDAAVMTMGFQVASDTTTADATTTLRLVTTVDSLYYTSVGFTLTIGNWTCDFTTDYVYETISGDVTISYAPTAFSDASLYFVTATVTEITQANYDDALTVTVYWTTLDGTTVTSTLTESYGGLAITGSGTSVTAIITAATGE